MSAPARKRATYEDVLAAPEHQTAELVDGELHLQPRPSGAHGRTSTNLGGALWALHDRNSPSGRGGWFFVTEPELHFGDDVVVPDVAGWRYDERPEDVGAPYYVRPPHWLCETLSPSTARFDRVKKMPLYARAGVEHVWLLDPLTRVLEAYGLDGPTYRLVATAGGEGIVGAPPFEDPPIDLASIFTL